jgi:putative membrane protein
MIVPQVLQMGGGMGGGWTFGFFGPLVGLLVMGLVLYVLWSAVSGQNSNATRSSNDPDAMETLRNRYARGEISDEEFEERARTLREK